MGWFLTERELENISKHKYSGQDLSLTLKFVLSKFYNVVIELIPRQMAPNMVTLIGFFFVTGVCIYFLCHCPHLTISEAKELPSWYPALVGFALFSYQTLDNLDGKQARRTGTSSPFGELLDHGCDTLATWIVPLVFITVIGAGNHKAGCVIMMCAYLAFNGATWEQYHTGTLTLGYINGPIEGLLISSAIFIITSILGYDFWEQDMPLDIVNEYWERPLGHYFAPLALGLFIPTVLFNVKAVMENGKKGTKRIRHMIPTSFLFLCLFYYLRVSPTILKNPLALYIGVGFLFSRLMSGLTLSHMAGTKYGPIEHPLVILGMPLIIANMELGFLLAEETVINIFAVASLIAYVVFVIAVILDIESRFPIYWVTVPVRKKSK